MDLPIDPAELSLWNYTDIVQFAEELAARSHANLSTEQFVHKFISSVLGTSGALAGSAKGEGGGGSACADAPHPSSQWCDAHHFDAIRKYNSFVHGYLSLLVCVFGTISNIINIWVLVQNIYYTQFHRILKWLAICDCLVMLEYIPFALYKYVLEESASVPERRRGVPSDSAEWAARYVYFHMIYSQLFHTAAICLTLTLAVWRWIALKFPQHSGRLCSGTRCSFAILTSFVLPTLLSVPTYMVFRVREERISAGGERKGDSNKVYVVDSNGSSEALYKANFVLHAAVLKLVPCVVLAAASLWLVGALRGVRARRRALRGGALLPGGTIEIKDHTTRMLLAVLSLFLATELPQATLGLSSAAVGRCFFAKCYNLFGELMDLLALVNGAVTLVLYCAMSQQFRAEFKRLFLGPPSNSTPLRPLPLDSSKLYSTDFVQTTVL